MCPTSSKGTGGGSSEKPLVPKIAFLSSKDVCAILFALFTSIALAEWQSLTCLLVCSIVGGMLLSIYVISISIISVILNLRHRARVSTINASLKGFFIFSVLGILGLIVVVLICDASRGLWISLIGLTVLSVVTAVLIIMAEFINRNC